MVIQTIERLSNLLADSRWDILEASSGREAPDIPDRQPVNLVRLDAAQRGIDCAGVLDAVRRGSQACRSSRWAHR
jgi:DNA-binding response OmpR family regulator